MPGVHGAFIYLGNNDHTEAGSVIENSFVTQNADFDFLLDMHNNIISLKDGQIAVPIYHMQKDHL